MFSTIPFAGLVFLWTTLVSRWLTDAQIVLDPLPKEQPVMPRSYIYSVAALGNITAGRFNSRVRRSNTNGVNEAGDTRHDQITSHNVSALLNSLFVHYNKTFRPGYGYGPTRVGTNMLVLSMGPISELNSDYSMDCYFRQNWRDERLRFTGSEGLNEIALNNLMLEQIWKPDTYFRNGKEYYVHTITTANKLLRLNTNGDILYSMRLTIRAQCPMRLTFYPADLQSCPLIIGSFAYEAHDIYYYWDTHGVKTENNLSLSQFVLEKWDFETFFAEFDRGVRTENYSMVRVDFKLQRRMGYFLLQIYLPCMLIVVLSWVSFWLNREATERLSLGITALLTLATMNQDQKDILPKTSYPTALEWYILICNLYVSASIIQFAAVHFFTKTGFEEINYTIPSKTDDRDEWEDIPERQYIGNSFGKNIGNSRANPGVNMSAPPNKFGNKSSAANNHRSAGQFMISEEEERFANETACQKFFYCITGNEAYRTELIRRGKFRQSSINSVSMLDRISRILFPLSFGLVNLFYWTSFLYAEPPKRIVIGNVNH